MRKRASSDAGPSAPSTELLDVKLYPDVDRSRVVFTLRAPAPYRAGRVAQQTSVAEAAARANVLSGLFLDIDGLWVKEPREWLADGLLARLRQSPSESGTRILFDLTAEAVFRTYEAPEPFRIIVDMAARASDLRHREDSRARHVSRVVLDPGHGGSDPGAIGQGGLREKDVVLDIAHRAAPLLSRELGIMTLLTRDVDRSVRLDERTARANAFHAELFLSIHCNAAEGTAARGVTTFVLDRAPDESAVRVAARENAMSLRAAFEMGASAANQGRSAVFEGSAHLAMLLQRATLASLSPRYPDVTDHGIKKGGFFVLLGAEMPAVLFEASFLSNAVEEKRLMTADYRQKLADGLVNAVRAYREGR